MFEVKKKIYKEEILNIEVVGEEITVVLSTYGGSIFDIQYINKNGKKESVVAHPISMEEFATPISFHGKTCGRTAGRIDKGVFTLDNKKHTLDINWHGVSCLHGGNSGVSSKNFHVKDVENLGDCVVVAFDTEARNGESGFEGDLQISIRYTIRKNSIEIEYGGVTNKKTLCNLTNHAYFNLSGDCKSDCLDHEIYLNASKYGNLNSELIATSFENVENNEIFNFKTPKLLKKDLYNSELQSHETRGYDHPFLLDGGEKAGYLYHAESGRKLLLSTTYPCVVMYVTCYPDDVTVANGEKLKQYGGICLEAQHAPNGVNFEGEDGSVLNVGEKYSYKTKFEFIIE